MTFGDGSAINRNDRGHPNAAAIRSFVTQLSRAVNERCTFEASCV
jgi:hypothetical protein